MNQPSHKRTVKKYKFNNERRMSALATGLRKYREALDKQRRKEIRNKQVRAEFRNLNQRPTFEE